MYNPDEDMCVWCEGATPVKGTDELAKIRPLININNLMSNLVYGNHRYQLEYPVTEGNGLSFFSDERKTDSKARLLGAAVFLNEIIKEQQEQAYIQNEEQLVAHNSNSTVSSVGTGIGIIGSFFGWGGGGGGRQGRRRR